MTYDYDDSNIFAKILAGEIPCEAVLETEHSLAFKDINPQAPFHVLVIPRGKYVNFEHFASTASDAEIVDFAHTVGQAMQLAGVAGNRMISNSGDDGHQDVPHLHVHVVAGQRLGPMLSNSLDG